MGGVRNLTGQVGSVQKGFKLSRVWPGQEVSKSHACYLYEGAEGERVEDLMTRPQQHPPVGTRVLVENLGSRSASSSQHILVLRCVFVHSKVIAACFVTHGLDCGDGVMREKEQQQQQRHHCRPRKSHISGHLGHQIHGPRHTNQANDSALSTKPLLPLRSSKHFNKNNKNNNKKPGYWPRLD